MKTIKIIDLLIMRANGEDTPKFWWNGCIHELEDDWENGVHKIWDTYCKVYKEITLDILNDEVKIIEEEKEMKKLDVALLGQCDNWLRCPTNKVTKQDVELNPYIIDNIRENTLYFQIKINELIDVVNELKGKSE